MKLQYEIRQAAEQDLPAIMSIEQQSFDETTREKEETFRKRIETFPEGFLLLTWRDGAIVGYCCSELWNTVPAADEISVFALGHDASKTHDEQGSVLYISSLALLQEYRGKGTGRWFLEECLKRVRSTAPQIQHLVLLVNKQWLPARHIYTELGFAEYGVIPGFFHDGDGIMMKKITEVHYSTTGMDSDNTSESGVTLQP